MVNGWKGDAKELVIYGYIKQDWVEQVAFIEALEPSKTDRLRTRRCFSDGYIKIIG